MKSDRNVAALTTGSVRLKRTTLCAELVIAFGSLVIAPGAAMAQDASAQLHRLEITGSSIKRIATEGALPVMVMKVDDVKASGVTSAVDLIMKLSTVQGSTGESALVGGQSFGFRVSRYTILECMLRV